MTKTVIILSIILTICPFILLPLFYQHIPEQIPAFVDIKRNPTLMMNKNAFSIFRLPLMGTVTQIICFTMFSVKLEYEREKNKFLWLLVSIMAGLKMSLTSMEVLIYDNTELLNIFRTIILISVCIAVVGIIFYGYTLYKKYNKQLIQYFSKVSKLQKTLLFLSLIGYVLLTLFPLIS